MKIIESDGKTVDTEKQPLRPNMLISNASATSSTIVKTNFSHCLFSEGNFFNSRFNGLNIENTSFDSCDFDGAIFQGCSLRTVEFVNCDVDRMIINGINIGNLLRLLQGSHEGGVSDT